MCGSQSNEPALPHTRMEFFHWENKDHLPLLHRWVTRSKDDVSAWLDDPGGWCCRETGTTDNVWVNLGSGVILAHDLAIQRASKRGECPFIMCLTDCDLDEEESVHRAGHVWLVQGGRGKHSAARVPRREDTPERTLLHARTKVRGLLGRTFSTTRSGSLWGKLRMAVRLLGAHAFARTNREARAKQDLQARSLRRMMNFQLWRAWRRLSEASPTKRPATLSRAPTGPLVGVGLRNLGNTCYMNAVLQALCHVPPLRELVLLWSERHAAREFGFYGKPWGCVSETEPASGVRQKRSRSAVAEVPPETPLDSRSLAVSLARVFRHLCSADSVFTPEAFLMTMWAVLPQFSGFQQRDADEFMQAMLDRLEHAMDSANPSVGSLLRGTSVRVISCEACGKSYAAGTDSPLEGGTMAGEQFSGAISVEIPHPLRDPLAGKRGSKADAVMLADCVRGSFRRDSLGDDYRCTLCACAGRCSIQQQFTRLPAVFWIHLSRTIWTERGKAKLQDLIDPDPDHFDPSSALPLVAPVDSRFSLVSVVEHHGKSSSSGHYTALCRDTSGSTSWVLLNDQRATRLPTLAETSGVLYVYVDQSLLDPLSALHVAESLVPDPAESAAKRPS
jgi:ubiquitin C-terminal hydrolase